EVQHGECPFGWCFKGTSRRSPSKASLRPGLGQEVIKRHAKGIEGLRYKVVLANRETPRQLVGRPPASATYSGHDGVHLESVWPPARPVRQRHRRHGSSSDEQEVRGASPPHRGCPACGFAEATWREAAPGAGSNGRPKELRAHDTRLCWASPKIRL